ncbi:MAG: UvrD-helicase domain-containing protein, partial [Proteobacteria bacterium]|nr:UvrD-helicase domain-containing protein [Pseudomonadota bacterium]MBU1965312.1 UvrD-helicase domain-containing protein [Pseudomonadota bacterium]
MTDYEKELNPEQLRVVLEEGGPLLVIAGAGSGKTRTLTYRVARLVESGVPPERILLATFTNKAARSMLTRVESLIGREIGGLWGGTFHHCAHRTLRSHAP